MRFAPIIGTLVWSLAAAACAGEPATPAGSAILNEKTLWRVRMVRETPDYVNAAGEVGPFTWKPKDRTDVGKWFADNPARGWLPEEMCAVTKVAPWRLPEVTPADWMKPEFDDSAWARLRTPFNPHVIGTTSSVGGDEWWKTVLMRTAFEVTDPAGAGELRLSLEFRGGALVYLNGEEVGRAFMGRGPADLFSLAEAYPDGASFTSEGFAFNWWNATPSAEALKGVAQRTRRHEMTLPAAKLRKGANVLALAFPRSPSPIKDHLSRGKGFNRLDHFQPWSRVGVNAVRLQGGAAGAVRPNTGPLAGRGFRVWNHSVIQKVFFPDYPEPFAPLAPVRLTGVRNGTFAGQVVVGDEKPIKGLKVAVSDLKGPGVIPAAAVRVRYALDDGLVRHGGSGSFDSLEETPPAEVPVLKEHGGSVQPLWITVTVPADAKPGDYAGSATVNADGLEPLSIPLQLRVIDWVLPDCRKFATAMDLVQSPESVALAYDVPLWSDAHFRLLDRTFALLAPLAEKTLFITCIRRTHFGNEHAMLRWVRGDDGELSPDFGVIEKYLDVAVRHLGPVPGVIFYVWEPSESQGHAGVRVWDKPVLFSLLDKETGEVAARNGPAWGTPESKTFWKKFTDAAGPLLKKRGIDSMMFGLIGDSRPTKQAMDDICSGVPGAKWAVHSHYCVEKWHDYQAGYSTAIWGIGVWPRDPVNGLSFGWSNPFWMTYFPRDGMNVSSALVEYRTKTENWMGALLNDASRRPPLHTGNGPRGLGRVGVDFWPVLKDDKGRVRGSLAGRYPEAAWGQLNLNNCIPYILGRGKDGPVATVRSETLREGIQELEVRIYLEKALLDDGAGELLGEDLIKRCRKVLDDRIRMCLHAAREGEPWFISSGWSERSETLFRLAAEVAAKYGGKEPQPNLKREGKKGGRS